MAVALAITASALTAAPVAAATPPPALELVAGSPSVTLDRWVGLPGGITLLPSLDLGVHVVADGAPFEVRVRRESYRDPIVATQLIHRDGKTLTRPLPRDLVTDFSGLPGFFHLTLTDAAGATVVDRTESFCPNSLAARIRPDAPDTSPFPVTCSTNPFALGGIWAIEAGWGASTVSQNSATVDLPDGTYTATVTVAERYRELFGIQGSPQTVQVIARTRENGIPSVTSNSVTEPATARPTAPFSVPTGDRPDLRPLPAWGITVTSTGANDYLAFNAAVWNAGPSRLVVEGFRRADADVMDAYQYFYATDGTQVGSAPTGTMEWDPQSGHEHWHFTDFASYRLLGSDQTEVVRSQKEAFCLANTDAIDYLVENANWKPYNTDLHSSCGDATAQSVLEVLEVGSGDTYRQSLPGQSFDITDLPNGTYYVQIIANPDEHLYETSLGNNVSLRKVILGGEPGARAVRVPPYGLVDAP